MTTDTIDAMALVILVENNWAEFVECACANDEASAERTLRALKKEAGMDY